MRACKITVIKRNFDPELVQKYLSKTYIDNGFGPCELFSDQQEFVVSDPNSMPVGFCAWAWSDMQRELITIMSGGNLNWMAEAGTAIVCCTDAFRPVVFKIELIKESEEIICLQNSLMKKESKRSN